jgi:hypothetical protein
MSQAAIEMHDLVRGDPAQRYQSCADALADIRAVHSGQPAAGGTGDQTKLRLERIALPAIVPVMDASLAPN